MGFSLNSAITQIRGFLNEPVAAFWTDTELTFWLQEGVRDFSSKSLMIEATGYITLAANQLVYDADDESFISDVIEPYAAIYDDGNHNWKGLVKVHPRQMGHLLKAAAGDPLYYCLHAREIYIWPLTTADIVTAGGMVKLLYAKETQDITEVNDEFQHIPLIYACAKAKEKDQKFQEANALFSQYIMLTNFERADKHGREEDSYDMFRIKNAGGEAGAR